MNEGTTGRARIAAALDGVARAHDVVVLHACEAGSRAWGVPDPGSDHDVRFVFVRRLPGLLAVTPPRDVIERDAGGGVDLVGWDLRKALSLALRGKPDTGEWARSPVVHLDRDGFGGRLRVLLDRVVPLPVLAHGHAFLAGRLVRRLSRPVEVPLKRVLHPVRAVMVAERMVADGFSSHPPVDIPTLLDGVSWPHRIVAEVRRMVDDKVEGRLGTGVPPASILGFLEERATSLEARTSATKPPTGAAHPVADGFVADEWCRAVGHGGSPPT